VSGIEPVTPDSILRLPDVMRKTGLSESTIKRRMKDGDFQNLYLRAFALLAGAKMQSMHGCWNIPCRNNHKRRLNAALVPTITNR